MWKTESSANASASETEQPDMKLPSVLGCKSADTMLIGNAESALIRDSACAESSRPLGVD